MHTQVHIPSTSHLKEYVSAVWETYGERSGYETILPRGIIELVFNLGEEMNGTFGSDLTLKAAGCFVQGFNTTTINVAYHGQHHLFGVRLQPNRVKEFLGVVPVELKDTIVDLTLIRKEFQTLWYRLKETSLFDERVKIIETAFPVMTQTDCVRSKKLCELFYQDEIRNFQSVDTLTELICYSSRHLHRKTQSLFGLSAEELLVYKKFLHAVKLIHDKPYSLTEIAYQCGFYDQSHFSRTFKAYAGMSPKQYKGMMGPLPFHLFS